MLQVGKLKHRVEEVYYKSAIADFSSRYLNSTAVQDLLLRYRPLMDTQACTPQLQKIWIGLNLKQWICASNIPLRSLTNEG